MSQIIPIYIPTYISDQNYNPSRVLPRLLFYNGMIDSQTWWFESGSTTVGGTAFEQNAFPYFDNYNVVSGSFPTTNSDSLLFYNEQAVYGEVPTDSLYSTYWSKYVNLLYNPRTRLLNASAIIPLADYFKMELNDIVAFRGNDYHIRAINDYNLSTGECNIQLLGPILPDALPFTEPVVPTTTTTTSTSTTSTSTTTSTTTTSTTTSTTTTTSGGATLAWSYSETGGANGEMRIYVNGSVVETRTNTSSGTYAVNVGNTIYVEIELLGACSGLDNKGNVYTTSNRGTLVDNDCFTSSTGTLTTATYTVVSGDIGNTISLDTFASCEVACL